MGLARERKFLAEYEQRYPSLASVSAQIEELLGNILEPQNLPIHAVVARPKAPRSVRAKLLRKKYRWPKRQVMDVLGARVMLYHARDVNAAVEELQKQLRIYACHSVDKRTALGLQEFGYRSVHLIASVRRSSALARQYSKLIGVRFEIQVRSVLEHAWAEIEHEAVYKSGAEFPDEIKRRFAAVAAVLELLEADFVELGDSTSKLVDIALARLQQRGSAKSEKKLDTASLLAILEMEVPTGLSFRAATKSGKPFPQRIEERFLLALGRLGIKRIKQWVHALRSARLRRAVALYAANSGIIARDVSHLAVLALAVGIRNATLFDVYFPEFAADRALWSTLE